MQGVSGSKHPQKCRTPPAERTPPPSLRAGTARKGATRERERPAERKREELPAQKIGEERLPDPLFFVFLIHNGRNLSPHTLLQAHLRLLRFLQKCRSEADGRPHRGHAPRTQRPPRLPRWRSGRNTLFRRRHPVALPAGGDRRPAAAHRGALRLQPRRGDHPRGQPR